MDVEPAVQQQFDRNLADYEAKTCAVRDRLTAAQRHIAELVKQDKAEFERRRDQVLAEAKQLANQTKPRSVRQWGHSQQESDSSVLSLGADDAMDQSGVSPPGTARSAPAGPTRAARQPRRRAARDDEDDDYSQQSWLES